jgi:hypothetical protein
MPHLDSAPQDGQNRRTPLEATTSLKETSHRSSPRVVLQTTSEPTRKYGIHREREAALEQVYLIKGDADNPFFHHLHAKFVQNYPFLVNRVWRRGGYVFLHPLVMTLPHPSPSGWHITLQMTASSPGPEQEMETATTSPPAAQQALPLVTEAQQ